MSNNQEINVFNLFSPDGNSTDDQHLTTASVQAHLESLQSRFLQGSEVMSPNLEDKLLAAQWGATQCPAEPNNDSDYVKKLGEDLVSSSVHCCSPHMIGHMTTSLPWYMAPLARLVTTVHANNVKVETATASTFLEREVIAMMHRQLYEQDDAFYERYAQTPTSVLGIVCSGGTIANNTALWIARNKLLKPTADFPGIEEAGMVEAMLHYGYKGAAVIGSNVMHYSLKKAVDVLGLGTRGLKTVPFDSNYQVKIDDMEAAILECRQNNIAIIALVGVSGGTETGSVDDLNAIADLADKYDIHFHVDAAWGGPVIFSSKHKHLMAGINRAHTITLDGHKQLYTPMGCGLCFARDPEQFGFVKKTANYIIRNDSYDLGKFSMEGSRPAMAVYLHANLNCIGVKGFGQLVDHSVGLVSYMHGKIDADERFEALFKPMTNILLYRYVPDAIRASASIQKDGGKGGCYSDAQNAAIDEFNKGLQTTQKFKGETFVSRTTIFSPAQNRHIVALRVVIANPLTTEEHIDATLQDQMRIADSMESASQTTAPTPVQAPAVAAAAVTSN